MSDIGNRRGSNPYRSTDGTFSTNGLGGGGNAAMNAAIRRAIGRDAMPGQAPSEPLRTEAGRLIPRMRATQASAPAALAKVDQRTPPSPDDAGTERDNLTSLGLDATMADGDRPYMHALADILGATEGNQGVVNTVQRALASGGYTAHPSANLRDVRLLFDACADPDIGDDARHCRNAHAGAVALQLDRPDLAAALLAGHEGHTFEAARDGLNSEIRDSNGF